MDKGDQEPDDDADNSKSHWLFLTIGKVANAILDHRKEHGLSTWQRFWPSAGGCFLSLMCQSISLAFLSDGYLDKFMQLAQSESGSWILIGVPIFIVFFSVFVGLVLACEKSTHRVYRFIGGAVIPPFFLAITQIF